MAPNNSFTPHAGSAASLLHYAEYTDPSTKQKHWSRFASADESFNVATAKNGSRFLIKFFSNFSKKHLATYSKKEQRSEAQALLEAQKRGDKTALQSDYDQVRDMMLQSKILNTLDIRSGLGLIVKCADCGHPKSNNPDGSGHSAKSGKCMVKTCTTCPTGYKSSYIESRIAKGKADSDPYAGKSAQDSSCLILNLIPLNEFETVVADSILAIDDQNALPDSAPKPFGPQTPFYHLKWSFPNCAGAVRHAKNGAVDVANGTWCELGAFKENGGPTGVTATWTIAHWTKMG